MESISRRVLHFYERFARAIDRGSAEQPSTTIHNNNPNVNVQYGSGIISNNNQNITHIFYHGALNEEAKITEALKTRYVPEAVYDAQLGRGCMEGTRVQILRAIDNWIKDPKAPQIFWLTGLAGTGKSAIAWSICLRATKDTKIIFGGSFFCSRSTGSAGQRDVRCVVPTLAQLLARQSKKFSKALAAELARNPDVLHKQIGAQVEQLLYKPLLALKGSRMPIVFVIDALDECGGQPGTNGPADDAESRRTISDMLEALVDFSRAEIKLPVKFLVTSRPETHIRDTPVSDTKFSTILRLHTVSKEQVTADIRLYVATRLSSSPQLRARFTADDADMLAHLCDGLFIVATTALQYALGAGIDAAAMRFKTLLNTSRDGLSTSASAPLDQMYALILSGTTMVVEPETNELAEKLQLLAAILCARMPLSVTMLADLLEFPDDQLRASMSDLHAIVHVPDDDSECGLRTVHASFGDYLYGRAASSIRISVSLGHQILARGCLRRFAQADLCFNVSQSQSSFKPNPRDVSSGIALSLIYACLQWAHHIDSVSNRLEFEEDVGQVFRSKFLFWLEVLSITGKVGLAPGLLRIAGSTVARPNVAQFLRDANAFVASSHAAISTSPPHIYISALPFAAKDSLVYQEFASLCTGIISVTTFGIDCHGGNLVATLAGHTDVVNSVAYSSDGHLLASGSLDGTVRIWDTRTGEEVITPLQSNDGKVLSVSFSPNGLRLVSGGEGEAVHVWNASTGRVALPPLRGHSSWIQSVAYSPDDVFIASGSEDKTVRLWKSETGVQVFMMTGHTDRITAIAFSPDSQLLASAARDKTVRLWKSDTGQSVGTPLTDLENEIRSLGFSRNGKWLAAGSESSHQVRVWNLETLQPTPVVIDSQMAVMSLSFSPDGSKLVTSGLRIQSWDPQTGRELLGSSLAGHSGHVRSVTFSPDGQFLASGSEDHTVRIWDTTSSAEGALEPLPAHSGVVFSVAVHPTSVFIVSGSMDYSVRVWDISTGKAKPQSLLRHTGWVLAVAISPDGRLIASASGDHSVRLWDMRTCMPIGKPLLGHYKAVNSVNFSADGLWLASGSDDKTTRVWDVATRQAAPFGPLRCKDEVNSVGFSPDGRLLAAGDSAGWVYLWRSGTNKQALAPLRANTSCIYSITFSPDTKQLTSGGKDCTVCVWDVVAGHQIFELKGHDRAVLSVAYSPDGLYIVTASWDKSLRLWDATDGTTIATFFGHGNGLSSVTFTPDGRSVVSSGVDNTIHVWDVEAALSMPPQTEHDPLARLGLARLNEDGWLVGSSGELLLWLPVEYRGHIELPPCSMVIGSHRVVLEAKNGLHWGEEWTACWRN